MPQALIVSTELVMYFRTSSSLMPSLLNLGGILTTTILLNTVDTSFGSISMPLLKMNLLCASIGRLGLPIEVPNGCLPIAQWTVLALVIVSAAKWNSRNIDLIVAPVCTSVGVASVISAA